MYLLTGNVECVGKGLHCFSNRLHEFSLLLVCFFYFLLNKLLLLLEQVENLVRCLVGWLDRYVGVLRTIGLVSWLLEHQWWRIPI